MKKGFSIFINTLNEGRNNLSHSVSTDNLTLAKDVKILGNVDVDLVVLKSGDKFLVEGTARFTAELNCAICGEKFVKEYQEPFKLEFLHQRPIVSSKTLQLSCDEVSRCYFQGEVLDLLPVLHDTILLAIPLAPTCQEECKGICPGCGVNLNLETCQCQKAGVSN
jgi:DUF177 domain-containing protein